MDFDLVSESANYLLKRTKYRPKIAIICGSGLGKHEIHLPKAFTIKTIKIIDYQFYSINIFSCPYHLWIGSLGESIDGGEDVFSYSDIPNFPISTAPSHKSRLLFGSLKGVPVLLMQGRFHLYEGYSIQTVSNINILNLEVFFLQ